MPGASNQTTEKNVHVLVGNAKTIQLALGVLVADVSVPHARRPIRTTLPPKHIDHGYSGCLAS